MLLHPRFAFIEMPRTGSTHIVRLLRNMAGAKRIGMHEPAPCDVQQSGRALLGSIRNPWDWYVSQWTIGCGRTGALHAVATRRSGRIRKGRALGAIFDSAPWRRVYADTSARDVGAFRAWLELLCTPEATCLAFPQAFGASDLHEYAGWYTYMYAQLFCSDGDTLHRPGALPTGAALRAFVSERRYITHMIHTEHLGHELAAALDDIGVPLTSTQRDRILTQPPSNRSHRSLPLSAYYNERTEGLIRQRDPLVFEHYTDGSDDPGRLIKRSWTEPRLRVGQRSLPALTVLD